MEIIKKHSEVLTILATIVIMVAGGTAFIISSIHSVETGLRKDISNVEKDVAVIKSIMMMKGITPNQLASNREE